VGHHVCALAIVEPYDLQVATFYGLHERLAHDRLVLFPIDHYWSAYWQAKRGNIDGPLLGDGQGAADLPAIFPTEGVIRSIVCELTGRLGSPFAVILSEYFGGNGDQWAVAFERDVALIPPGASVNDALRALGVVATEGRDEWDTIGLGHYRSNPSHLERFEALCAELGV